MYRQLYSNYTTFTASTSDTALLGLSFGCRAQVQVQITYRWGWDWPKSYHRFLIFHAGPLRVLVCRR